MYIAIICIAGSITALAFSFLMYQVVAKSRSGIRGGLQQLEVAVTENTQLKEKVEGLLGQMTDISELRKKAKEVRGLQEAVKTERGRITITRAELETVETRLRELEEIERELEASGVETKEELNILEKKEKELGSKNEALKAQIAASMAKMDELFGQIQMTAEMQEQVTAMKTELLQTEEKIDLLLVQIEQGNDQYFGLKKRYDALDIEYAQLFEKFSAAEESMKEKS